MVVFGQEFQKSLAEKYQGKKLPKNISDQAFNIYINQIPDGLYIRGQKDKILYSKKGTIISYSYERIVVGDYGAFIEINPDKIIDENIEIAHEEFNNPYYSVRTPRDSSSARIMLQKRAVEHADFIPGMYYISPFDIKFDK